MDIQDLKDRLDMYLFYIKDIIEKPELYGKDEINQVKSFAEELNQLAEEMEQRKGL